MRQPAASDTICAIASGVGGAIGVLRVSGPGAEPLVGQLAPKLPRVLESHRLYYAHLSDPDTGERLDEAMVVLMRAPRSYTGETVVELHVHGGTANLGRLLGAVVRAGARLAEPGEFTRRAFLAGRIDLARAEAVAEVIAARSERAVRLAQAQLRGSVSAAVARVRARVVELLAEVEASVDFPDERLDFAPLPELALLAEAAARETDALGGSQARGRRIAEGLDVALVGRANAGKSSLLNALAGEERALVDSVPGTTRDFLEVELQFDGLRVTLVDTAGERDGAEGLEQRGLMLGRERRRRADVVVLVVDATVGFGPLEAEVVAEARGAGAAGVPVVVAWNKGDLGPSPAGVPPELPVVITSALRGEGLSALVEAIHRAAGDTGSEEGAIVTSERQRALLVAATAALASASSTLRAAAPPELVAVDLRTALDRLGEVTGETFDDAVLDRIFARFCIGK